MYGICTYKTVQGAQHWKKASFSSFECSVWNFKSSQSDTAGLRVIWYRPHSVNTIRVAWIRLIGHDLATAPFIGKTPKAGNVCQRGIIDNQWITPVILVACSVRLPLIFILSEDIVLCHRFGVMWKGFICVEYVFVSVKETNTVVCTCSIHICLFHNTLNTRWSRVIQTCNIFFIIYI